MHASMFNLDLGSSTTSRDRAIRGRALAAELASLPGFVAFIALEAPDGSATGLCFYIDAQALENAHQSVMEWQSKQSSRAHFHESSNPGIRRLGPVPGNPIELLSSGEVIVQRGF